MIEPLVIEVVLVEIEPGRASPMVSMAARVAIGDRTAVYPSMVSIGHEPSGRPVAEGVALSLTHSGTLGAVAITEPHARVGVDVEAVRPRRHLDRMARRIFGDEELAEWSALEEEARLVAFLRRWTEVEAVLKALGTGVGGGFSRAVPWPDGWSRASLDLGSGFVATVAADVPAIIVRTRWLGT